ncbi:hypothetical protein P4J13_04110 [Bacillus anthracis]|uniref:hypothetical protein n=1 Tax=Bacillus anthracis TaxID=1392 RepID=UPI002DB70C1F|nr:hypothetical protein [Bacillus anthracis]MEB9503159.1 hypothetical protein [Bacillus anthracis]
MGRTSIKINDLQRRVSQLEMDSQRQQKQLKEQKYQIELLTDSRIIQMLEEKNSRHSNKPRYSYEEISAETGRSVGYISNLAKENGLSRRNLKSV